MFRQHTRFRQALIAIWWLIGLCAPICSEAEAVPRPDADSGLGETLCTRKPAGPKVFFRLTCIDDAYESWQDFKKQSPVRVSLGAIHWWNIQRESGEVTYGFPSLKGTYFYSADIDIDNSVYPDQPTKFGIHTQVRYRDQSLFRTFFSSRTWLYESYGWLESPFGILKAGKIRNRIGFDWDNSFWGNVEYFDGYKLDPDYGVSLEQNWKFSSPLSVDSYFQYFLAEDNVNGSFTGGDPESTSGYDEDDTYIVRLVPKWSFNKTLSLSGGVTGFHQSIKNTLAATLPSSGILRRNIGVDGYALDMNLKIDRLDIYTEYLQSFGVRSPNNYVTGGPSSSAKNLYLGANYDFGPILLIAAYSRGEYSHPAGIQDFYLMEARLAVTQYLALTLGYVYWTAQAAGRAHVELQDAFQVALTWNL